MLEHQATLDVLWDCIHDLDNRPTMTPGDLTRLWEEIDRAIGKLQQVATDVLAEAAEAGDRDDAASA